MKVILRFIRNLVIWYSLIIALFALGWLLKYSGENGMWIGLVIVIPVLWSLIQAARTTL